MLEGYVTCHFFYSYYILTSSVIHYWTDTRQLGIYFLLYKKELKYTEKKSFNDDVIYTSILQ